MKRFISLLNVVLVLSLLVAGCAPATPVVETVEVVTEVVVTPAPALPTPPAEFKEIKDENREEKSGQQSGEWGGVIFVKETVTVPEGKSLTIKPGTLVLFKACQGLNVQGTLKAEGKSEKEPIIFRGENKEKGSWEGINVIGANASANLKFCLVKFGNEYNIRVGEGAKAEIVSCEISNARWDGIQVYGAKVTIASNRIHDNRWGIHLRKCSGCDIHHNAIYDHYHAYKADGNPDGPIANGIHIWDHAQASCKVYSNTLANRDRGICKGREGWGIELGFESDPEIKNNIITGFGEGIIVHEVLEEKDDKGNAVTIQAGNLIVFTDGNKAKGDKIEKGDRVLFGNRRSNPTIESNWLWNNSRDYSEQVVAEPGKIYARDKKTDDYPNFTPVTLPNSNFRTGSATNQSKDPLFCNPNNKDFRLQNNSPEKVKGKGAYPAALSEKQTKDECK